jgi:hypothetical protein
MKNIILLLSITLLISSCERSTYGCIEPAATNYNINANYDNGNCTYISDIVFYEDVAAAIYFDIIGVEWLDLSIDGEYIGTLDATLGLTYTPDCNEVDAIAFSLEWENSHSSSFTWVIRDENGFKHYEGAEVVVPNDCLPMELTFKKIQDYKESK